MIDAIKGLFETDYKSDFAKSLSKVDKEVVQKRIDKLEEELKHIESEWNMGFEVLEEGNEIQENTGISKEHQIILMNARRILYKYKTELILENSKEILRLKNIGLESIGKKEHKEAIEHVKQHIKKVKALQFINEVLGDTYQEIEDRITKIKKFVEK
jgi:hypothetical protein